MDCAIRNQRLTSRTGQSSVAQVPAAIQGLEVHPVFCSAASDYDIQFFLGRSCQAFENVWPVALFVLRFHEHLHGTMQEFLRTR